MKIPNYSERDTAIHAAPDQAKDLQTPSIKLHFQVGDNQLKAVR